MFDAVLATHPLFPIYVTIAQVVLCKEELLSHEDPYTSGFEVFKDVRDNS